MGIHQLGGRQVWVNIYLNNFLAEKKKPMKRKKLETQEQENLTDQGAREWRNGLS